MSELYIHSLYLYSSIHQPLIGQLLFIPNLDLVRILSDVRVHRLLDQVSLAARDSQDQVVKRAAAQDVYVVAGTRPTTWAEAIGLVPHLDDFDGDLGWVVARHAPAAIAHVAG
jgi:hypothetical protein